MVERIIPKTEALAERERKATEDMRTAFPDGEIASLDVNHKSLGKRLSTLYPALGYEKRSDMIEAWGFKYGEGSKGGRRSTLDPEAIISALLSRYEGKEKPDSLGQLQSDNPDIKGKIKTLSNDAKKHFGQTLAQELKDRGLIVPKAKKGDVSDDEIHELLDVLVLKYATAKPKPSSISELENDNPERKGTIKAFYKRCSTIFGTTPLKKLEALGIIERPGSCAQNASVEELEQAIVELGKLVSGLSESKKPDNLPALEKAFPEYSGLIKAGKAKRLIDKELLQKLGIIAPSKVFLRREGIRRASAETLTKDYLGLGKSGVIMPEDADSMLLPPSVVGIDLISQVELRECFVTVRDKAAVSLNRGDRILVEVSQIKPELGDPYIGVNVQTEPATTLRNIMLRNDLVEGSKSELSAFIGGEVISVSHGDLLDVAQMRVRYLEELNRDTLAYLLRELGYVTDKDLNGSMEWRYRIWLAGEPKSLFANAVFSDEGVDDGALDMSADSQSAKQTQPDDLTDGEIEDLLAKVKARYAHAVRPKNLKSLSDENPDFGRNTPLIKRYLKAHGYGSAAKYLEDQEIVTRFWREDSLPRPEDEILEEFQSKSRMTAEELLTKVPHAKIIEFETTVTGSVAYGQPPLYEMLRIGDYLDAWVDKGTWVHMSFCGHDLGLVGWKERYEYCLTDYIDFAKECGVVTERIYAQITGFAGGPKAPKAKLRVFFAIDRANQQMVPVKKDVGEWGYDFDGA